MKRYLLFLLALTLLVWVGCDKMQSPTTPEPNPSTKFSADQKVDLATIKAKMEAVKAKIAPIMAKHKAKLEAQPLAKRSGAMGIAATIEVPDDFPTIQDAVDAALPGDKITVKASGSPYSELVVVGTPNLRITASGTVTVLGGFGIDVGADGVTIEKFTINSAIVGYGIYGLSNSGGKIKDNTIDGAFAAFAGIILDDCLSYTVEDNVCSRNFVGILGGLIVASGSSGSLYKGNHCWENLGGIAIGLGNGNQFIENTCSWNYEIGLGIFESNNNELQKNVCKNNAGPGFLVTGISSGNIIRPDNIAQKNKDHGIILDIDTFDNKVKENTFTLNTPCDILDDGTGNVFKNNTFGCKTP